MMTDVLRETFAEMKAVRERALVPDLPLSDYAPFMSRDSYSGNRLSYFARDAFINRYGFHMMTQEQLDTLAGLLLKKKVLEAGAGTGWVSHALRRRGVQITASDIGGAFADNYGFKTVWQRDHTGSSCDLLPGDWDVIMLGWPPYEHPFGALVARALRPGQVLLYQGEGRGGCTADDDFFDEVTDPSKWRDVEHGAWERKLMAHHLSFEGIHDRWWAWERL